MEAKDKCSKKQQGRWTKAQHKKFLKALEKYGRNWPLIQKKIKTRTLTQIRSHAYKIFIHVPEEDLDAFIGFDGHDSRVDRSCVKKENEFVEKTRASSRIQSKKEKEKVQSQISDQYATKQGSDVKLEEEIGEDEKLNRNFVQNSSSQENKEQIPVIDSFLKDQHSSETTNPLEYLQVLENDHYGGNFLLAAVNQLALNNTLKMMNLYSSLSL